MEKRICVSTHALLDCNRPNPLFTFILYAFSHPFLLVCFTSPLLFFSSSPSTLSHCSLPPSILSFFLTPHPSPPYLSLPHVHFSTPIPFYRPVNGANFVYYGMRLVGSDTKKAKEMVAYADGVLDALQIKQGPSHMEVINFLFLFYRDLSYFISVLYSLFMKCFYWYQV